MKEERRVKIIAKQMEEKDNLGGKRGIWRGGAYVEEKGDEYGEEKER